MIRYTETFNLERLRPNITIKGALGAELDEDIQLILNACIAAHESKEQDRATLMLGLAMSDQCKIEASLSVQRRRGAVYYLEMFPKQGCPLLLDPVSLRLHSFLDVDKAKAKVEARRGPGLTK